MNGKTRKSNSKNEQLRLIQNIGYDQYMKLEDTGKRWIAEAVLLSLKRVMGEQILSNDICHAKSRDCYKDNGV